MYLTWGIEGIDRSEFNSKGGQLFTDSSDSIGEVVYDKKFELNEECQKYIIQSVCEEVKLGQSNSTRQRSKIMK